MYRLLSISYRNLFNRLCRSFSTWDSQGSNFRLWNSEFFRKSQRLAYQTNQIPIADRSDGGWQLSGISHSEYKWCLAVVALMKLITTNNHNEWKNWIHTVNRRSSSSDWFIAVISPQSQIYRSLEVTFEANRGRCFLANRYELTLRVSPLSGLKWKHFELSE